MDAVSPAAAVARVDCEAPALAVESGNEILAGEAIEPVVAASDATSGLATVAIEVSVDGGEWREHVPPLVAEAGRSYVFRVRAADVAGNWTGWAVTSPVVAVAPEPDPGEVVEEPPVERDPLFEPPVEGLAAPEPGAEAEAAEEQPTAAEDGPELVLTAPPAPREGPAPAIARRDPRLRITRVLTRRNGVVDVAGTAASGLRAGATVTVRHGRHVERRRTIVAGGRWQVRLRVNAKGRQPRSVEVAVKAGRGFAAGTATWRRTKANAPARLARTPAQ